MIKNILLATDGSEYAEAAWQYARDIARAYKAWLRVISVVDSRKLNTQALAETERNLEAECSARLEELKTRSEAVGIHTEVILAHGVAQEMICAHDSLADVIAMGHQGQRSTLDQLLMGSVAAAVIRTSCRPVLISPGSYSSGECILGAYDGSDAAKRALSWAADLATTMRVPLDVVHVNPDDDKVDPILLEAQEYLKPYNIEVQTFAPRGEVAEQILQTAHDRNAGIIVMGAYGQSRVREALLGSVTGGVLQKAERPLLMIR